MCVAVWVMFTGSSVNESCDDEGSHLYTPTRVFAVSKMELYIIGDGLLFRYRDNYYCSFYNTCAA